MNSLKISKIVQGYLYVCMQSMLTTNFHLFQISNASVKLPGAISDVSNEKQEADYPFDV